MFTISLLSSPQEPALEPVLVENLRSAWGGVELDWLSAGEAAEFRVRKRPDNFWSVWNSVQEMGIDIVFQPTRNRKKTILIADMDSTIIQQECVDELADAAGFGTQVSAITARAMDGEIDFEDALRERVMMLKGLETTTIDTVLKDRITLMPGATELLATMKSRGAYCALVSGGFTAFTESIANRLGFDEHRANVLLMQHNRLSGRVAHPILGSNAKVVALNEISTKLETPYDHVMAVGDGANDLGMLKLAGTGVAMHAKPSVAAQCDIRINNADLTALLFLQGYRRDEFVA